MSHAHIKNIKIIIKKISQLIISYTIYITYKMSLTIIKGGIFYLKNINQTIISSGIVIKPYNLKINKFDQR